MKKTGKQFKKVRVSPEEHAKGMIKGMGMSNALSVAKELSKQSEATDAPSSYFSLKEIKRGGRFWAHVSGILAKMQGSK